MAVPKKGALHQILAVMVDATDFASVKSTITESDFNSGVTKKFYGVNTGVSTATTSGTISKTASLVRSGVFRIQLKTTENNYDHMMVRLNKTGCAEQIYEWDNVDNDDSDFMSFLSDFRSDFQSRVPKLVATNSQLSDLASDIRSFLVAQSALDSDLYSLLSDFRSDFQSRVPKLVATNSQLSDLASDIKSAVAGITVSLDASNISDIASAVVAALPITSQVSDIYSMLSDFLSDFQSRVPKLVATNSQVSDLDSDILSVKSQLSDFRSVTATATQLASRVWSNATGAATASRVLVIISTTSDIRSHVSDLQSDFQSRVPKRVATDSQLSDVSSDIRSFLNVMSGVQSDVYSLLSDFRSDFQSRVPKAVATNSQLSDLASDVKSLATNTYSLLSDFRSDFQSRVPKLVATNSQLSDLASDLKSAIGNVTVTLDASNISDIGSAVVAALPFASTISDIYSLLSDLQSDFQSRVPKLVATGSQLSDVVSDAQSDIISHLQSVRLDATGIDQILDDPVEGSITARQALRLMLAALAGKLSGGATTTITIRDTADSKNRIVATVDADGNRTAVSLDPS